MGTVFVDNLEPQSGTSLTLGASGDTVSLGSGGTVTNVPAFAAKMSASQQLSNDTSTKIAYDTEVFDTDGAYDHSSNYRFTVPSGKAGKYFIGASIRSGNMADTKKINLFLFINGSEITEHFAQVVSSNTSEQYTVGVFKVLNLSASDYVEVFVLHQNGAAVNFSDSNSVGSYFYGYRLIGA